MLDFMARAVEEGPATRRESLHAHDAVEALLHGAELARSRADNLADCGRHYDLLYNMPVPEPSR